MKLLYNLLIYVFFQNLLISTAAGAEYSVGYGSAAFHGDLTSEQRAPLYMFQAKSVSHAFDYENSEAGFFARSFVAFEVVRTQARHNGHHFPYGENTHLSFLGFFITPGLCSPSLRFLNLCASIGIGTLNVNSTQNRQDYGTWNYQLESNYRINEKYFLKFALKKIGDVEQTANERASHFWLTAALLSIGLSN